MFHQKIQSFPKSAPKKFKGAQYRYLILATFFCPCLLFSTAISPPPISGELKCPLEDLRSRTSFLISVNKIPEAIEAYEIYKEQLGHHDSIPLIALSHHLIDAALDSETPHHQLAGIYGASISFSQSHIKKLHHLMRHAGTMQQIAILQLASSLPDAEKMRLLNSALMADQLQVRYMALNHLVSIKSSEACTQIQLLLQRIPPAFYHYFCELLAKLGNKESQLLLDRFLTGRDPYLRTATLSAIGRQMNNSFLPYFKNALLNATPPEQEVAAVTLGRLGDLSLEKRLSSLIQSPYPTVSLAASIAQMELGFETAQENIFSLAHKKNLFAIAALGQIEKSESLLSSLLKDSDSTVSLNALLALLEKRHPSTLDPTLYLLQMPDQLFFFTPIISDGGAFTAWKISNSPPSFSEEQLMQSQIINVYFKQMLLNALFNYPPDIFLQSAKELISLRDNFLAPSIVEYIASMHNPKATLLLRTFSEQTGWPLLRFFSHLALYQQGKRGYHKEILLRWVNEEIKKEQFRFVAKSKNPFEFNSYEITPEENLQLLINILETIANVHEKEGLDIILNLMKIAHPDNRFFLASILLKILH